MTTYIYKTNNNPPTEDYMVLVDACEDKIRSGEALIKIIKRAVKHTDTPLLIWQNYLVVEKVQGKHGFTIQQREIN